MTPAGTPAPIDFVTVVHGRDLALWRLQARSFARYGAADLAAEIFVVVNDADPAVAAFVRANLPEYGPFRDRVRTLAAADLLARPEAGQGWRRQQALKLIAGGLGTAEGLVWLDGKNHFLGPFGPESFFEADGRARTIFTAKKLAHDRRWLGDSLAYFGVDRAHLDRPGPLTYTPYPMRRDVLADMLAAIEAKSGGVEALFRRRGHFTEFYLLYAFVLARHGAAERVYSPTLSWPATIWKHGPLPGEPIARHLARFERLGGPFFAVHQNRRGSFPETDWQALARLWRDRDLLGEDELDGILGPPADPQTAGRPFWRRLPAFRGRLQK